MRRLLISFLVLASCAAVAGQLDALLMAKKRAAGYLPAAFVTTWTTATNNTPVTLPLRSGYTYTMTVDWGDGSALSDVTAYNDEDRIHTYATAGTYTNIIEGTCRAWYFNNGGSRLLFRTVKQWGSTGFTGLGFVGAFYGCQNATSYPSPLPYYPLTSLQNTWFDNFAVASFPDVSNLVDVANLSGTWRRTTGCSSYPNISMMTAVATIQQAWYDCSAATVVPVLPSASTALLTSQQAFQGVGSKMGGTVVALWNTNNFPKLVNFANTFTGATGLDNYGDIPNDWKGL